MERFEPRTRHHVVAISAVDGPMQARPETFDEFYARTVAAAGRLGHLLTGSVATGHDVAHDALAAVHARWAELDNPDAYLRTTIVNLSRGVIRRWTRERAFRSRFRTEVSTSIPELDDTWRAVRRLPARQRAVVVLRFYEDLPIDAIAELLEVPAGTVKSTLHCALHNLKELLR